MRLLGLLPSTLDLLPQGEDFALQRVNYLDMYV